MRDETTTHAPKAYPYLFNGAMVRAILDGRKTKTRRPLALPVRSASDGGKMRLYTERDIDDLNAALADTSPHKHPHRKIPALRKPGDLLWVRETWHVRGLAHTLTIQQSRVAAPGSFVYAATPPAGWVGGWRPPSTCPDGRRASRSG